MLAKEACVFGDSIARGVILDDQGSYKPLKDCFASLAAEELGVALVNKARFGCTIAKGREIIERTLDRFLGKSKEPVFDYVFLEFGGNDCDFRWDEISVKPYAQHLPATPPELFVKQYSEVIEELRARGLKPILLTLPPLVAERYFAWFTRTGLDQKAILKWLGDIEFIYRWHESYSCLVWEIGEKYDAPVIDIRKTFLEQRNYQRFLCKDGIYPNVDGHSLIKAEIVAFAKQHLVES